MTAKKRWIVLGSGIAVAASTALAAAWSWQASTQGQGRTTKVAAPARERVAVRPATASEMRDIGGLLADGSPQAWGEIVSRYPGSDDATKRKILQHVARIQRLDRTIDYVLATVGEDPTPSEFDPMVSEAASLLRSRLRTPADFDHARQAMVMQETDKRRWVLANALVTFAKDVREGSAFDPLKGSLAAKLIDLHSQTRDPFVRSSIVDAVDALGNADAALILAKGVNVRDEDLESVRTANAAARGASDRTADR